MPYIYETSGRFICAVRYQDRHIPELAGFQFSKQPVDDKPIWWTNRPEVAYRLLNYCEESLAVKLKHKFKAWRDLNSDDDITVSLPHSPRYKPEDYQIAGAKHILSRKYSYLWYEAGTGKTFTALMALEVSCQYGFTNVVVCPSSLKYTWLAEIDDKSYNFLDVLVLNKAADTIRSNADIIIIPDSLINTELILKRLAELNIGVIVIDEAHRFKNEEASRTKSVTYRTNLDHTYLGKISQHLCAMSGTPLPNERPVELWPVVNAFAPEALGFMTKYEYGRRYCESVSDEYGTSYGGCANVDDLITKLKTSGYVLYQELREGDVPPQANDEVIYLDPSKESIKVQKQTAQLMESLNLEEILSLALNESSKISQKFKFKASGGNVNARDFIAELRKLSGEQVADEAVRHLKDTLTNGGEPIVVFAWHKSVITKLTVGLKNFKPLVIDGSVPMKDRQKIVDEYQNGNGKLIILQIVAGGLGFTLTKSNKVYFVEFDWVVGNNEQCVRRLRRKGQTRAVQPYYFVFKNSLAHLMLKTLGRKSANQGAINAALKG